MVADERVPENHYFIKRGGGWSWASFVIIVLYSTIIIIIIGTLESTIIFNPIHAGGRNAPK